MPSSAEVISEEREISFSFARRTWWAAIGMLAATAVVRTVGAFVAQEPVIDRVAVAVWVFVTASVAWLISVRRPRNPCGWLLGTGVLLSNLGMTTLEITQAQIASGDAGPLTQQVAWLAAWLPVLGIFPFILLLLRFPDGRLTSPRSVWLERSGFAGTALLALSLALAPGALDAVPEIQNPLGVRGIRPITDVASGIAEALLTVVSLGAVASLFGRYRRGGVVERQRLKWIAYSVVFLVLAGVLAAASDSAGALNEASFFLVVLGGTAVPVAIGIAILRYRLFDIDLLINRTIVYTLITMCVIGFYVAIVGSLTGVIGSRVSLGASLIATAIVAIGFHPVLQGLQRGVNRLMYGQRDEPYSVLAGLGRRLEEVAAVEAVLPAIAEDVAESLRLPYVAIVAHGSAGDRPMTVVGAPLPIQIPFPLSHHGEEVGELIVSPRSGEETITARDQDLLLDLARQIGPALRAASLAGDLQRSRAAIVRAREEERRRLRRDLHDGLGPELAGISLGLAAAEQMVGDGKKGAPEMLAKLNRQLKEAVSNVRTIVSGLVPPELDHLGLVGAVKERVEAFSNSGDLRVVVSATDLPSLPAAVEVAAYRVILEAVTNVAKHAGATQCSVEIKMQDDLWVQVSDNGRGLSPDHPRGTGLSSMRERVEELGGIFVLEPAGVLGTRVVARLPVVLP